MTQFGKFLELIKLNFVPRTDEEKKLSVLSLLLLL